MPDNKDKSKPAETEAKSVKAEKLTETEKPDKNLKMSKKSHKKLSKKAIIAIITGVALILIAAALVICLVWKPWEKTEVEAEQLKEVATERVEGTDYNQKITKADGGEFTPKITEGSTDNLEMRFADLKCEENCTNVNEVKIGDKTLKRGEDYELKQGSVILVLYAKVFSGMEAGEVRVTFEITEDHKIHTIGVKITIEKKAEEKKEEQKTDSTPSQATTSTSSGSSTSAGSSSTQSAADVAKASCEARTDGPIGVTTYHFLSSAEKKDWIATYAPDWSESEVDALYTSFSGGPAQMHYLNGYCRPSISASGWTGVGAMPISNAQLSSYGITLRQDFISWTYADGRVENQITTNLNQIWGW